MYNQEEKKQLRLDFWEGFGKYSHTLDDLRPNRGRWMLYNTGIKHFDLKFEVLRYVIRIMIEVNHHSEDERLKVYSELEKYRSIIEGVFGATLVWDFVYTTPSGNEVCRIYVECADYDFHKRDNWSKMYVYMSENMVRMELAFMEVRDFIKSS